MYDNYVDDDKFRYYRGVLNKIYQGFGDEEEDLDVIIDKIQEDYERGELSSSQYDNLMSLVQDIEI
jgi:hypothetical protein